MSILIEHGIIGLAEADHRIANNLASLSGVIRLQRNAISKSGKTFTAVGGWRVPDGFKATLNAAAENPKDPAAPHNANRAETQRPSQADSDEMRTPRAAAK